MKADKKIQAEVAGTVKSLLTAYADRDLEKVMALYVTDPDVTALGTNLDQFLIGQEEIRHAYEDDFEAFSRFGLEMTNYLVSIEGNVAWIAAECHAFFEIDGDKIHTLGRLTSVLVRREGEWRIIQSHLSFPSDESGTESPQNRL